MSGNLEKPTKHQAQLSFYIQCLLSAGLHVILLTFWIRTQRVTGTSSGKNHQGSHVHSLHLGLSVLPMCQYLHMLNCREFCCLWGKWQQEGGLSGFKNWNIYLETTVNYSGKRNAENKSEEFLVLSQNGWTSVMLYFPSEHRVFISLGDITHLDELYTTIRCRTMVELLPSMGKALGATHVLPKEQLGQQQTR